MSRELKFRVYSYEDKKYRTDCGLTKLFNSMTGSPAIVYNDDGDNFDIEQYTCIKDKNDKEIYENDIIKDKVCKFVVCFEDGKFICKSGSVKYDLYNMCDVEVIGNIHENKYRYEINRIYELKPMFVFKSFSEAKKKIIELEKENFRKFLDYYERCIEIQERAADFIPTYYLTDYKTGKVYTIEDLFYV